LFSCPHLCGLLAAPIEPFLHLLSSLEMGVSPFWNWDLRASTGITACSGVINYYSERSEAAQLDPFAARQRSGNFVE
jgi:hypothetical protein